MADDPCSFSSGFSGILSSLCVHVSCSKLSILPVSGRDPTKDPSMEEDLLPL